jgi:hypothetical protein
MSLRSLLTGDEFLADGLPLTVELLSSGAIEPNAILWHTICRSAGGRDERFNRQQCSQGKLCYTRRRRPLTYFPMEISHNGNKPLHRLYLRFRSQSARSVTQKDPGTRRCGAPYQDCGDGHAKFLTYQIMPQD